MLIYITNNILVFWYTKLQLYIHRIILEFSNWVSFQNSTLTFGPTSAYSTINRLEFELFDSEGLSNQYSILIKVANDFKYNPDTIEDVIVLYSISAEIDISQLLYNSISEVEVVLHEGSKEVAWAKYIDNKTILISNFTQYDFRSS